MNLSTLITTAWNENKIEEAELIKILTQEIEKSGESKDVFERVYKKAYGPTISKDLAEQVVMDFAVTDGSERVNGQKWTMEQTSSVGSEIGIDWGKIPKINFYIAMNMCYSDYYKTGEKLELKDDPKLYAYLAKDWLCDSDTKPNKLYNYIFHVIM